MPLTIGIDRNWEDVIIILVWTIRNILDNCSMYMHYGLPI